jgi:hypothetical protein
MVLHKPYSLCTMFFSYNLAKVFVLGGTEPLLPSPYDGLPVLRSIYALNTILNPPTWTLAFDGGGLASTIAEIKY